ncbi:AcrR family transcriptional regulator [Catenuloplanes nepalensis]|uniref:AcrR family transcriptional regulator n=1 Tax=Catenuloplanes nepalensis TaxID=587533 RepID=A0ABT9MPM7_9ACTN|nr:TetR family transcriptional regulator [Catenuloplanes nepalensis]MDP9793380.1 AcrR family transcriptional regulator [Catenuloplanes nepalensis]
MSPRPPASARLDRGQILDGAMAIADRDGVDALSLRKLAADLKVTPMALYWHFKDKDALLDELVERLLSEAVPPEADGLDAMAAGLLRALLAHPGLAGITPVRFMRTDAGITLSERTIGLLRAEGHSPIAAAQLSMFILNGIVNLAVNRPGDLAVHDPAAREALVTAKRGRLKSLDPAAYPHLTETADHFLGLADEEDYYARGLAYILAGARR